MTDFNHDEQANRLQHKTDAIYAATKARDCGDYPAAVRYLTDAINCLQAEINEKNADLKRLEVMRDTFADFING